MPDDLLAAAKELAVQSGRTLTAIIEDSLRESLGRQKQATAPAQRIKLITEGKGGLRPGVDLSNSAELLDIMESRGGSS